MKCLLPQHVIGVPITSAAYSPKKILPNPANGSPTFKQSKQDSVIQRSGSLVRRVQEHVKLGPKISETVKGKLSLAARILQVGGVKKVFKQLFSIRQGEKLLKASQCYLSTTTGPIAGLLFISTDRVAFCSERSIKFSTPNGDIFRTHYKVMIPRKNIKNANHSVNMKNPSEKYIEIVTVDNFDFWFMGFVNYHKAFKYLQKAISHAAK